jgi:hypothetical protein
MEQAIFVCDCGLVKVAMAKLHSVGDDEVFGGCIHYLEATVVVEGWADAESLSAAEVPRLASRDFVVDDDGTTHGSKWSCIVVEGSMKCFPC